MTTEWEDIQIRMGNMAPRHIEKPPTEEDYDRNAFDLREELAVQKIAKEIADAERNKEIDDLEFDLEDDQKFLEEYRQRRIEELKEQASKEKYSELTYITEVQWKDHVTNVKDVYVVVFLFKHGIPHCQLMEQHLRQLAKKFKATKFVMIQSEQAIRNYPDRNLPTILVYYNSDIKKQFVGLAPFGGEATTTDIVEWELAQIGAVQSELEQDPRKRRTKIKGTYLFNARDEDEEDED
mmetsp:Transcript_5093/g.7175  ORF Transcript_5093/g.7175 Transcript_5093/m.7175 type:complete len:237 (+) Transcript_5093:46-756(+)